MKTREKIRLVERKVRGLERERVELKGEMMEEWGRGRVFGVNTDGGVGDEHVPTLSLFCLKGRRGVRMWSRSPRE